MPPIRTARALPTRCHATQPTGKHRCLSEHRPRPLPQRARSSRAYRAGVGGGGELHGSWKDSPGSGGRPRSLSRPRDKPHAGCSLDTVSMLMERGYVWRAFMPLKRHTDGMSPPQLTDAGEDSGSLDSDVANPRPPDHEPGTGVESRKRNASWRAPTTLIGSLGSL